MTSFILLLKCKTKLYENRMKSNDNTVKKNTLLNN